MALFTSPAYRTHLLLFVAFLLFQHGSWAQSVAQVSTDSVDAIIKTHMTSKHIQGVSVAVVRQGKVTLAKGYGLANVELNVPVTPQSVFAIASVSKQFIATGILMLAQEGKLGLDDDIHKFYPDAPQTWQGITLRHLLSHTSGIVREAPAFDPAKIQPDSVVVQSAFPLPLQFPTGTKWQYCNVGYFALADIIRKVSGQPWATFFETTGLYTARHDGYPYHNPERNCTQPGRWL
ncbi:serine hydrolase domain-containing protein [Spirosoma foliorum]|uniref:Beta-lactamase family protein n=1 Tax=Spirosoma foliorum TaxID=2710596 RepID=A0A7G5GNZ9_9BACT|nr:serine hydrolase domain-containing protein [Spirosoma foliorum]QMW00591.1 beta-lactamase family protein [Spirosoma foliorum]